MPLNCASIKISQGISIIRDLILCDSRDRVAIFFHGNPGIGKSAMVEAGVKAAGDELGGKPLYCSTIMLSQIDSVDLRGIGVPDLEAGTTRWMRPEFFPADPKTRGILFFDEFNTAPPSVQAPAYQALHDYKVGENVFPAGIRLCAAGNLDTDKAIVHRMSTAADNRMTHFKVEADLEEWAAWGLSGDHLIPEMVSFLRFKTSLLHKFEPDKALRAFPSPRSWHNAAKCMRRNKTSGLEYALISGNVGEAAAAEFTAFLRIYRNLPSVDAILLDPKKAVVPEKADAQYAIAGALAYRADGKTMANIITYLARLPGEFAALTMRDALSRDSSLKRDRSFLAWCVLNKSFLF